MSTLVAVILLGVLVTSSGIYIGNGPPNSPTGSSPQGVTSSQQPSINSSGNCHADGGTLLAGVNTITVNNGNWADIEWYRGSDPEKDSVVGPGTYTTSGLSGKYWIFSGCSSEQEVNDQVNTHIQQRLQGGANNVGQIVPFSP